MAEPRIAVLSSGTAGDWLEQRRHDAVAVPSGSERARSRRSDGQRDRDRILYSSAFQRLGFVTQVSAPESSRVFHTRLTHSLKVAQFARRLAERLQHPELEPSGPIAKRLVDELSPDSAEASALAHDLGHPPFGHLAEKALESASGSQGLFEGNAQSFRILTKLALRSQETDGLNLTRRTLNGALKYPWLYGQGPATAGGKWGAYEDDREAFEWARSCLEPDGFRTLEAQIMDWADDVTYAVHDLDDFYRAGLIPLEPLSRASTGELKRVKDYLIAHEKARFGFGPADLAEALERIFRDARLPLTVYSGTRADRVNLREAGSELVTTFIEAVTVVDDEQDGSVRFRIDEQAKVEVAALKALTWAYVIDRPQLGLIQHGQRRVICELYEWFMIAARKGDARVFPPITTDALLAAGSEPERSRCVIDMIAGLTEPQAYAVHARMAGADSGPLLGGAAPGF